MTIQAYTTPLAASLLLGLTAACHSHFDGYGHPNPSTIVVGEVEVNDHAWDAQHIGWVQGGDTVIIEGGITDDGWDPRDGFQFFAETPLIVDVSLDAHLPGVDLDWCIWDPTVGAYTVCAESPLNPETGSFVVVPPGNEFHLVVSSFTGSSSYTIEVYFSTYYGLEADAAPVREDEAEASDLPTPRMQDPEEYASDRTWDVPTLDHPLFTGPLFEFEQAE